MISFSTLVLHPLSAVAHVKLHLKPGTVMDLPMVMPNMAIIEW